MPMAICMSTGTESSGRGDRPLVRMYGYQGLSQIFSKRHDASFRTNSSALVEASSMVSISGDRAVEYDAADRIRALVHPSTDQGDGRANRPYQFLMATKGNSKALIGTTQRKATVPNVAR